MDYREFMKLREWAERCAGKKSAYEIGDGLKLEGNTLSVDVAQDFEGDNTRPVEAAFMETMIGNVEALLKTI